LPLSDFRIDKLVSQFASARLPIKQLYAEFLFICAFEQASDALDANKKQQMYLNNF